MHPMLNIAIRAARKAGNFIAQRYEIPNAFEDNQKDDYNFITNIVCSAEHLIVEIIRKSYSQHVILCKESGELAGKNTDIIWIIDSLDGIRNFTKRLPHFAVSISVCIKGRTEVAAVYDPMRNELFTASRGQGAQLNGYRLRGGSARDLDKAIVATEFPLKQMTQHNNIHIAVVGKLFSQCADFRRTGSSVLDLAYVAAGRLDGFFEIGLESWDLASGELLVREAGGLVTDLIGGNNYRLSGNIIAGNPRVAKAMLLTMRNKLRKVL